MKLKELKNILVMDKKRYAKCPYRKDIFYGYIVWLRLSSYIAGKGALYTPLKWLMNAILYVQSLLYGIQISPDTKIGGGIKFNHFSGIVFAYEAEVGENCTFHQNVTLGIGFRRNADNRPILGNGVVVFPNAIIIGVRVGDNSVVLANSVVTHDVPPNSIVGGNPARVITGNPNDIFDKFGMDAFRDYV